MLILVIYMVGVIAFGGGCLYSSYRSGDDELIRSGGYLIVSLVWPIWLTGAILLFFAVCATFIKELIFD